MGSGSTTSRCWPKRCMIIFEAWQRSSQACLRVAKCEKPKKVREAQNGHQTTPRSPEAGDLLGILGLATSLKSWLRVQPAQGKWCACVIADYMCALYNMRCTCVCVFFN